MYAVPYYAGFKGKAYVVIAARGEHVLRTNGTLVASIDKRGNFKRLSKIDGIDLLRCVNAFRVCRGIPAMTMQEWKNTEVVSAKFLSL